jgi:hypothetical protein
MFQIAPLVFLPVVSSPNTSGMLYIHMSPMSMFHDEYLLLWCCEDSISMHLFRGKMRSWNVQQIIQHPFWTCLSSICDPAWNVIHLDNWSKNMSVFMVQTCSNPMCMAFFWSPGTAFFHNGWVAGQAGAWAQLKLQAAVQCHLYMWLYR